MAPLTWRNVNAPDLGQASDIMARGNQSIQGAFNTGAQIGQGISDDRTDLGSRQAMQAAQQISTSADWAKALAEGTAYGGVDPRYINADTLAWGADRRRGLLAEEQIVQSMDLQRQAAARAAAGGGRGGGGGGTAASKKGDAFAVAQARGAVRLAEAEFGAGSPEALKATNDLAAISMSAQNASGYLDAADGYAGAIAADRSRALSAGDAAVAAMSGESGFNPYAVALAPAGIPASPPSTTAAMPAQTTPSVSWGMNMGTAVPNTSLSFGESVAPANIPFDESRPVSWGEYAQGRLGTGSTANAAPLADLPPALAASPQAEAYLADVAAFEQSSADRVALREQNAARTEPNDPTVVRTAFDASKSVINRAVEQNPEFALYENISNLNQTYENDGPAATADAVASRLGMSSKGTLQEDITLLARDTGTDFATAAAAIASAGGPENYNPGTFWDMNNLWQGTSYYDSDKARAYIETVKADRDNPDGRSAARNELGALRSELNGVERAYALRKEAEVKAEAALAARPNDTRLQADAQKARAATLAADKAAIDFREGLTDRLVGMGMTEGVGRTRPNRDDYISPATIEATNQQAAANAAEQAQIQAEFGTTDVPTNLWAEGVFNPGSIDPNSPGGQSIIAQNAPVILSEFLNTTADPSGSQETFFNWVSRNPEARNAIFSEIQNREYSGESINLPESVQVAYDQYTQNSVPDQAIADLTALGFDLSGDTALAAAVANDPEVQSKLRNWRDTDTFWRSDSTKKFNRQTAQAVIRDALARNRSTEE